MKYTYKLDLQGLAHQIPYLRMAFDRPLSTECVYRRPYYKQNITPDQEELMDCIAQTEGVLMSPYLDTSSRSELINLDGCNMVVLLATIDPREVPVIVSRIVKKIQRRIAPWEHRKRITHKRLLAYQKRLNHRTWGE